MNTYPFTLKELPYDYEALSPVISSDTLKFHHDKHLQAYTDNLNAIIEKNPELQGKSLEEILSNLSKIDASILGPIKNNGGGVWNHVIYFDTFCAPNTSQMPAKLEEKLTATFGSVDKFKEEFVAGGVGQFGSGWVWLVQNDAGDICITKTANQDNPLNEGLTILLGLDVWEHAYYLDYQNRRPDHLKACFDIINWDVVASRMV